MPKIRVARQGESVESIASEEGLLCDTIWRAAENEDLRTLRGNPHVLLPDDVVFIPDIRLKTVHCSTGRLHQFRRRGIPSKIRVRFMVDGRPRASEHYTFTLDGVMREGRTNPQGWLEEKVPPLARQAVVRFELEPVSDPDHDPRPFVGGADVISEEEDEEAQALEGADAHVYVLDLRDLDPPSELTGAQGRLVNLGYPCGGVDGELGPRTREALQAFQKDHGLNVTGELDGATIARLQVAAKS